jgi:hypothetical protein
MSYMKTLFLLFTCACFTLTGYSQVWVNLELNHLWNENAFTYGTIYEDESGNKIEIQRVQYYLSGLTFIHDGAQETKLTETFVLASSNITHYSIGLVDLINLEEFSFDLGIDQEYNHLDPNSYPSDHPLSLQVPSMHWGWSAGYIFLVINGLIDSDNDNVPDRDFQFQVTANNHFFTQVDPIETSGDLSGTELDIHLNVNIADWLVGIDLMNAGFNHGDFALNGNIMANTNNQTVFESASTTSIENIKGRADQVYFDYTMPYAPTIYYSFLSKKPVTLSIMDMQGKLILKENNLSAAGNYFINRELRPGSYLARLEDAGGKLITKRFLVR